jgi:hypothetical protein
LQNSNNIKWMARRHADRIDANLPWRTLIHSVPRCGKKSKIAPFAMVRSRRMAKSRRENSAGLRTAIFM